MIHYRHLNLTLFFLPPILITFSTMVDLDLESGVANRALPSTKDAILIATGQKPLISPELKTKMVQTAAGAAAATAITSAVISSNGIVDFSSYMTVGFAPYVVHQHNKLKELDTMRQIQNKLRQNVNDLAQENLKLESSVSRLEKQNEELAGVKDGFDEIVTAAGCNADDLINIVKEFKEVQGKMKKILKARLLHQILAVILRADREDDFVLSDTEMEILIIRMTMVNGVTVNQDLFREKLMESEQRDIKSIMKMIRSAMDDEEGGGMVEYHVEDVSE